MAACSLSLYSDYILERENRECIEDPEGFVTFKVFGKECYIQDIYIVPLKRRSNKATELATQVEVIAKERGCTIITGSVCPSAKNSTDSIKVLIAYGFKLMKSEPDLIWFAKEVK